MAKGRYVNPRRSCRLEYGDRFLQHHFFLIYGHRYHLFPIFSLKSSLNFSIKFCTAIAAPSPRAHKVSPMILFETSVRRSMSSSRPAPFMILSRIALIQPTPSLHGVHLPHDSCSKNLVILRQTFIMSTESSKTITAPEPSILPCLDKFKKSIGQSILSGVSTGVDTPPGI